MEIEPLLRVGVAILIILKLTISPVRISRERAGAMGLTLIADGVETHTFTIGCGNSRSLRLFGR